jgi:hypothetical protein
VAHVFTPGLRVAERAVVRRTRRLPIAGEVLVAAGARVEPRTPVARAELPGRVFPLNLANLLHVAPGEVPRCLRVRVGESFGKGRLLAASGGLFGMFGS